MHTVKPHLENKRMNNNMAWSLFFRLKEWDYLKIADCNTDDRYVHYKTYMCLLCQVQIQEQDKHFRVYNIYTLQYITMGIDSTGNFPY